MSVPKFSIFTPGREFKKSSPLSYKTNPENPFRKNTPLQNKKYHIKNSNSNSSYIRKDICSNCGIQGHPVWKCDQPISSYGILLIRGKSIETIELVMIMRQDSYDYLTLIKNIDVDSTLLPSIAKGITKLEKQKILTKSFNEMWNDLYGHTKYANHKKIYNLCKERFETLRVRNIVYNLKDDELEQFPKWSVPKGKPKPNETWLDCAFRELKEETGIQRTEIKTVIDKPLYHLRTGSDGRSYIGVYYIAILNDKCIEFQAQSTEVQSIEWKTLKCLKDNMVNFPISEIKKHLNDYLK